MARRGAAEVARALAEKPREALVELILELYRASSDNRGFVEARLAAGGGDTERRELLEEHRRRIAVEFASDPPRAPRLGAARKAIRDYRRTANDLAGTADLMLTYVEEGTRFSREHGDMSDAYYHSLGLVLDELADLLGRLPQVRAGLAERLEALRRTSRRVGWTWGGFVAGVLDRIEGGGATDG